MAERDRRQTLIGGLCPLYCGEATILLPELEVLWTLGSGAGVAVGASGSSGRGVNARGSTTNTQTGTDGNTNGDGDGDGDGPTTETPEDCPKVPLYPSGASVGRNLSAVDRAKALFGKGALDWFYEKVRNAAGRRDMVESGMSWDYKQLGRQYEEAGNFNFGATGQRVGFKMPDLLGGSAYAHFRAHGPSGLQPDQLLQESGDWGNIRLGFTFAKNGCH